MNTIHLIHRLHQHRSWVNKKLLGVANGLSQEQLCQAFEIGQGSILKSLIHLYAAEYVWLEALKGNETPLVPGDVEGLLPGNQQGAGSIQTLNELHTKWNKLNQWWDDYLEGLNESMLDDLVYKTSTSSGFGIRHATRRSDVLLHICTHVQYTTAQTINMLRHVGETNLPDAMLISLAREENL